MPLKVTGLRETAGFPSCTSFAQAGHHMNFKVFVLLALVGSSCLPCEQVPRSPQSLCHRADAGPIVPDASFVIEGQSLNSGGTCQVTIDGGLIDLTVAGGRDDCGSAGNGVRAPGEKVRCTLPPLAPGTYGINSSAVTFSVSQSADSGLPSCL